MRPCPGVELRWDAASGQVQLIADDVLGGGRPVAAVAPGGAAAAACGPWGMVDACGAEAGGDEARVSQLLQALAPGSGGREGDLAAAARRAGCRGLLAVHLASGEAALWESDGCHAYLAPGVGRLQGPAGGG